MRITVVQPAYHAGSEPDLVIAEYLLEKLQEVEQGGLIVLPEYSNAGGLHDAEAEKAALPRAAAMKKAASGVAREKCAYVAVNVLEQREGGIWNSTYLYDTKGDVAFCYDKIHLPPSEVKLGVQYGSGACTCVVDGIRFGFMTCYDVYYSEQIERIAAFRPDILLIPGYQRGERVDVIRAQNKLAAFRCNAYIARASYSMNDDMRGGCSMLVAPDGHILKDMGKNVGSVTADVDVKWKYTRPAGFGSGIVRNDDFIGSGARPEAFDGVATDALMPYPRLCAHRGFSTLAPENSLPAYGAAIALGAEEIELDLWPTKDGEIVSIHDDTLDRVSTGSGKVYEHTLEELKTYDFGIKFDAKFEGLRILTFEEILQKFARQVVMNVHVKPLSYTEPYPQDIMEKIVALVRRYGCARHTYFMLETDEQIAQFKAYAPDIPVCVGHLFDSEKTIVDRAIALGAQKVQLFKPYFDQAMIDKAHAHGILCNVFWSDDPEEAHRFLDMGIDCVLTNDYLKISNALRPRMATSKR